MDQITPPNDLPDVEQPEESVYPDYSFVNAVARIAFYDDLRSAPRVTEVEPAETSLYIETLASQIYEQASQAGGVIPYTVIREVSENFIHARFKEIIVSILDRGNTIRFADQGPGISFKDKAQLPGFSSAIEPMKSYIRGVGSGLPIVKEYLEFSHGEISIEDNMGAGSVVTISVDPERTQRAQTQRDGIDPWSTGYAQPGQHPSPTSEKPYAQPVYQGAPQDPQNIAASQAGQAPYPSFAPYPQYPDQGSYQASAYASQPAYGQPGQGFYPPQGSMPAARDPYAHAQYNAYGNARVQMSVASLTQRERDFLPILLHEGVLGVTELSRLTDAPTSSTYAALRKLEEAGLVEVTSGQKRTLTPLGQDVARAL